MMTLYFCNRKFHFQRPQFGKFEVIQSIIDGVMNDKSNDKERICIYLAIDQIVRRELQGHMIFFKVT